MIGLLVGREQKDRVECCKIVTSTSGGLAGLMNHAAIKRLCKEQELDFVGMIQGPGQDQSHIQKDLEMILQGQSKPIACAIAVIAP